MIKISRKADYAIFLLCYVSRREQKSEDRDDGRATLMSAAELIKLTGLSHALVANLLKDFARAGILQSVRGRHGGYRLARPASELNLREILAAIEGPFNFVECARSLAPSGSQETEPTCGFMHICPSKGPMQVLHNRIIDMLEKTTLAELAQFSSLHDSCTGHPALLGQGTGPAVGGRKQPETNN